MSEFITTRRADFRWQLLTTVSALSLLSVAVCEAKAEDATRPVMWIELGGQLEAVSGNEDPYAPSFTLDNLDGPLNATSPLTVQKRPPNDFGGEGKITFQPEGTDWTFSIAARYGRSTGHHQLHQQSSFTERVHLLTPDSPFFASGLKTLTRFNDARYTSRSSHTILDFTAGKDVGVGLLGHHAVSQIGFGVRFAQFSSKSSATFRSLPDPYFPTDLKYQSKQRHHSYYGHNTASRSFSGVGPSISWSGNSPFIGDPQDADLTFDWGVNAAVLFGRQKVLGSHHMHSTYFHGTGSATFPPPETKPVDRSHSAVIPNVGGFAGLSVRYPNAKLSIGYRADFFFGAMDQGVDLRDSQTQGFHGPFATVSIGFGG